MTSDSFSPNSNNANTSYDIIIFGATSFVGQILAQRMLTLHPAGSSIRWAMAGRSLQKLESVRSELKGDADELPLIVADSHNEESLITLCQQTKVVISTVGPYALYGELLVKACAQSGTDYCDLTGEAQWIARMLKKYEGDAKQSGARIVNCCGFDSIPSDLGVHFLQQQAKQQYGQFASSISMRVKALRGTLSGGTLASGMNLIEEATADKSLRREMANPYSLCGKAHGYKHRQQFQSGAVFDKHFNKWSSPFIMAAINSRIVLRSHFLMGNPYSETFQYDEAMLNKRPFDAYLQSTILKAFTFCAAFSPLRAVMNRFLPQPGEGPSKQAQIDGFYDMRFLGHIDADKSLMVKVTGDQDPGYGSTAKMLAEAALCFIDNAEEIEQSGGFLTPATAFGNVLLDRLTKNAGLTFEVID